MRNIFSRRTKLVVAGLALAGSAVLSGKTAQATPATLGFYPATDIYGKGNVHGDFDTYGKGLRGDTSTTAGLTYGIGPDRDGIFGRSEVGFDYIYQLGGQSPLLSTGADVGERLIFNLKTQLYNNDDSHTRIVVGGWGLGQTEVFAPNIGYITGSKTFGFGRVHLGVARSFSSKNTIAAPSGRSSKNSISLGYDRYLTPKLQFAADYYSGKNGYAGVQPTLYYYINDKANFGLGYFRLNDSSITPRNQVYVCFDYNFDLKNALSGGAPKADPTAPAAAPETATGTAAN